MADNSSKRAPLEQLRGLSFNNDRIPADEGVALGETRDACVSAFDHHVRGVEIGTDLRSRMAGDAASESLESKAAMLLEMNMEIEEGKRLMPLCDERVSVLRKHHRI